MSFVDPTGLCGTHIRGGTAIGCKTFQFNNGAKSEEKDDSPNKGNTHKQIECKIPLICEKAEQDPALFKYYTEIQDALEATIAVLLEETVDTISKDIGEAAIKSGPIVGTMVEFSSQLLNGRSDAGAIGRNYLSGHIAIPVGVVNLPAGAAVGIFGPGALNVISDPFIGHGKNLPGTRYSIEEFNKSGPR